MHSTAVKVIILTCMVFFSGCSEAPEDYYFPLGEGKYWRYQMIYQTMDGNFRGVYAVENLTAQKHGDEITHMRRLLDGSYNFFQVNDTGILLVRREKTIDLDTDYTDTDQYLFQFPLQVGTAWESSVISKALIKTGPPQKTEFHIRARVPVTARIASLTDTVTVPAGTFENCLRIESRGDSFINAGNYVGKTIVRLEETNWYAPGVGLVKSFRQESTKSKALDQGEITLELESYR